MDEQGENKDPGINTQLIGYADITTHLSPISWVLGIIRPTEQYQGEFQT